MPAPKLAIERDHWLTVRTSDPDAARRFFGVEATREVKEVASHPFMNDDGLRTYRVKLTPEEIND